MARHCHGFEEFRRYLLGSDGVAKDADWAAAITGVAADTIRDLARHAADVRSLITCAWSLQRAHHGEQPFWATITLASMLGGVGLPGGGFAFGHGSANGVGMPRIAVPAPEVPLPANPAKSVIPVARIADMLLDPGGAYEFNGRHETYPDVRLVYWAGGNPFHHHQDLNRLQRAWQKPETIVVHESWWNPTARHADIVLPATTPLERNDIGGSSRDPFVFAMHRAIDPVHEARNDFDIFRALARRLGYEQAFTEGRDEMGWCNGSTTTCAPPPRSRACRCPASSSSGPRASSNCRRPNATSCCSRISGAIPTSIRSTRRRGASRFPPTPSRGFGYDDCPAHPTWFAPAEWLGADAASAWPIHLVTHQPAAKLHSQMDPGPVSRAAKIGGREPIRINPADAAQRGIADGDVVRVFNGRGACLAAAIVDANVMPQVAVMATGAWFDPSETPNAPERHGNPNVLTLDIGTSRLAQGPSALTALVEIERYAAPAPPVRAFMPPKLVAAG